MVDDATVATVPDPTIIAQNAADVSASTIQSTNIKWYEYITVEPTMFLYMFAFQLTSVIEQAFFVHKTCKVNHNYSAEICNNLTQYIDINKEVQVLPTLRYLRCVAIACELN